MTVSPPSLILVTGASGFIGAHIVAQLLDAGYHVRGTARGERLVTLRDHFQSNPNFEAVAVEDIVTADLATVLEGVNAVIHTASPIASKAAPEDMVRAAVDGTLNVLRQTVDNGIHKVVITSSWSTFMDPAQRTAYTGVTITEKDWGETTVEDLINGNHQSLYVYSGTKILAERAAWRFAKEHPQLDLATINPPFLYGAFVVHPGRGLMALGSNLLLYRLIAGKPGRPLPLQTPPFYMHVADAAQAHLLALKLPKLPSGADICEKRFLVVAPEITLWADTVQYLREKHPELEGRLPSSENVPALPGPLCQNDTKHAESVLGLKKYVRWQDTVEEVLKALFEVEKSWS